MARMKTPGAVVIISAAAVTSVLAQDAGVFGPGSRYGLTPQPGPYHSRSCLQGPGFGRPCPGRLYGWSIGRDRSRVGGVAWRDSIFVFAANFETIPQLIQLHIQIDKENVSDRYIVDVAHTTRRRIFGRDVIL
jgi:hypothetical protein